MRGMHRIVLLVGLVAIAPVLTGCEDFDIDKFDVFGINQKKKLPGDRKELFPQGVPGVTQGIPPEYLTENQPPPETAQTPAAASADPAAPAPASKTAAIAPAEEPKPKPKRKPKPKTVTRPATQITVQPTGQSQDQQQPLPPWPGSSPQQAPQQNQPPPPGAFSR